MFDKCVGLVFQQEKLYLLSLCEKENVVDIENMDVSLSMNIKKIQKDSFSFRSMC